MAQPSRVHLSQPQTSGLEVTNLVVSYEGNQVVHGLDLSVRPSEFMTLLGPSGCGKSTTLRCVAGLHKADSGTIVIGDRVVSDGANHVRPEHRNVNMVFQSYAVWPHMTVFDNVAYGLRRAGVAFPEVKRRVDEMLDLVGLGEFAGRGATGLSGGQQQRVALARALATRPKVLLLDEPLSNLDSVLRARMRAEIMRLHRELGTTTLYVTHDCSEALSMSDRIAVLDKGRIDQLGAPVELYDNPANRFVARFLGPANFIAAEVVDMRGDEIALVSPVLAGSPQFVLKDEHAKRSSLCKGAKVDLVMRPERLALRPRADSRLDNHFPAETIHRDFLGAKSEVRLRSGEVELVCDVPHGATSVTGTGETAVFIDPRDLTWVPREARSAD